MRLLLDESVPRRLRRALPHHEVKIVVEMGWSGIKNGNLLALAAASFDAFITVDKNLPYQQNLSELVLGPVNNYFMSATATIWPQGQERRARFAIGK